MQLLLCLPDRVQRRSESAMAAGGRRAAASSLARQASTIGWMQEGVVGAACMAKLHMHATRRPIRNLEAKVSVAA